MKKKRIGLIGCGNLGYSLAYYIGELGFDELHIHDLDSKKVTKLKPEIGENHPSLLIKDRIGIGELDVVILSLSGSDTTAFVTDRKNHTLFKRDRIFVSLGRPNYDDLVAHQALNRYLTENKISLLFGFGLEPGLVEVLMHHLASIHRIGELTSLSAICGGIPQHPNPPLNYDLLFGNRLPALNRKAIIKIDGKLVYCLRFDMKETSFVEDIGLLEGYHDGLSPYLLASQHLQGIPNVKQQTARWPGFFDCMRILISLGLLNEQKELEGRNATPSDFTHTILLRNGNLTRNKPDISFVKVEAQLKSGERVDISVVSTFNSNTKMTGMAQLTSFMAVWAAWQVTDLANSFRPGLILSHEFFVGKRMVALLDAFQKHVQCTVKTSFGNL